MLAGGSRYRLTWCLCGQKLVPAKLKELKRKHGLERMASVTLNPSHVVRKHKMQENSGDVNLTSRTENLGDGAQCSIFSGPVNFNESALSCTYRILFVIG